MPMLYNTMPIISVKNLGKKYSITHQHGRYIALRDVIANVARNPLGFLKYKAKQIIGQETKEEFWALKDINFEVQKGEVIGIIGANGAGKSTLLKILTGITPPTTGEAILRGKVASLLEVGTGFHPELTGRENIFLNGAILGMTRKEIAWKFDEIVAFSGTEKFLDTPMKYYSSGMYVRLAFSVAAHMEPDILLVDEVLAVGDAEFQKKCLGKMEEVTKKEGRTILFVSHNMGAIQRLCQKTILLEKGKVKMFGETEEIISAYLKDRSNKTINFPIKKPPLIINHFDVFQKGSLPDLFSSDKIINIIIDIELEKDLTHFRIGFFLKTINGEFIVQALIADWQKEHSTLKKGKYKIEGIIPSNFLNAGKYLIEIHSSRYKIITYNLENEIFKEFTVTPPLKYNENYKEEKTGGSVLINPFWNINKYA